MRNMNISRKTLLFFLVIGICGFFYTSNAGALQDWRGITIDDLVYIEIAASVTEVNIAQAYLIVGDKKFHVARVMQGGKLYKTVLLDQEGREVPLNFFRRGQMVFVGGFTVPDGRNAAFVIKRLSASEEARVKKGLGCNSAKLIHQLLNSLSKEEMRQLNASELMRRLSERFGEKYRKSTVMQKGKQKTPFGSIPQ